MTKNSDIHNGIEKWEEEHFNIDTFISETIENLDNKNADELQIFTDLHDSIKYMDIFHELKEIYPESYLDAKFHQKKIALNSDEIPINEKNDAFYDWLNVCINSKNDTNINFYFEKQKPPLSKEDEIKNILFKNGELRDIFKNDEWQIRLKKIKTWFLKRYDLTTSKKIHKNLINRQRFEWMDFIFLRLICAILIGFIPFIFNPEIWDMNINWLALILSIFLIPLILFYFIYECSKVIDSEKSLKDICRRVIYIFGFGLLASFVFSFVFYLVFSEDSAFSIKIGFFLAIIAYFIGVLVQIIWEENTVAEPL